MSIERVSREYGESIERVSREYRESESTEYRERESIESRWVSGCVGDCLCDVSDYGGGGGGGNAQLCSSGR